MTLLAVAGEALGVDGVGLGDAAERADEGLDLAGVGPVGGNTGLGGGDQQVSFVAAGGFADHQAVAVELLDEGGERLGLVGDLAGLPGQGVEHDDLGLADVAADDAEHSCVRWRWRECPWAPILEWLGIVCGRRQEPVPSQLCKRQRERMGGRDDGGRVVPIARRPTNPRGGRCRPTPTTASLAGQAHPSQCGTDNREPRSRVAIQCFKC